MKQRQTNTIARLSNRCIVIFMVGRKYKPSPWVLSFPMPSLGCQNALVDGALHSLPDQCDRSTSELNVQDRCTEVSSTYAPIHSAYSAMPNSHILANSCQTNKEVARLNHPFSGFVQLVVVKKLPGLPRHGLPCYPIDPVRGREPCQLVQDTQKNKVSPDSQLPVTHFDHPQVELESQPSDSCRSGTPWIGKPCD